MGKVKTKRPNSHAGTMAAIDRRKAPAPAKNQMKDRRAEAERRKAQIPVALDRRKGERRLGERRRQVDPTTCERDYTDEEISFMKAMEDYKAAFARPFPTWSEVLEVLKSLGYRKVAGLTEIVANRAKSTLNNDDGDEF